MQFIDQLNRKIEVENSPKRIVSIVPSQTELLVDLGLTSRIVGVTKFCIHPADLRKKTTVVGGTKNLNIERIKSLNPDLILANKEENDHSQILELEKYFPVWISDIKTLNDSIDMILAVGLITDTHEYAKQLCDQILNAFNHWENVKLSDSNFQKRKTAVYLIWNDPMMSVNRDTFINDLMNRFGVMNLFESKNESRYPIIIESELIESSPDFLFLATEPFPFKPEHHKQFEQLLPNTKIVTVDGEMFSWYGSRLLFAPKYFEQLFQDIHS